MKIAHCEILKLIYENLAERAAIRAKIMDYKNQGRQLFVLSKVG